ATARPKALGWGEFAPRGARTEARFVLLKKKRRSKQTQPRKQTRPKRTRPGKKARPAARRARKPPRSNRPRSGSQLKAKRGAIEPWLLATSLPHASAATVCDIYATRMQIEETFRDTKNPRFGWSLQHARYRSTRRLDNLF